MQNIVNHLYLWSALAFAVYSQCVVRWRLDYVDEVPEDLIGKLLFVIHFIFQPWIFTAVVATILAGLLWVISLTKFELNYAYPWTAMIFVVMMFAGAILFGESLSTTKIIGTSLIVIGVITISLG